MATHFKTVVSIAVFFFNLFVIFEEGLKAQHRGRHHTEQETGDLRKANDLFEMYNFKEALDEYLLLYKRDSTDFFISYRLGLCYLNTNIDKAKALPLIEYAIQDPDIENEAWYELGRAYQYNYLFDEAIEAFRKYQRLQEVREDRFYIPASRQILMCRNAIELMKEPLNVSFHNMGNHINSPYPDFNPYVPADESFLVFTSQRSSNIGRLLDFDGYYTADVYMSNRRDGEWARARGMGGIINTELVEETAGISSDGNILFFYIDNYTGYNDIIWAHRRGRSFARGTKIGPAINTNNMETAATICPNHETIIFASLRRDGFGGTDLYISRKLPDGEWSEATNLGPTINTNYNEDYPMFSHDGKTLYFASQGHNSMGGYDIFKSHWDIENDTWSKPENLGYPINTPDDNLTISFSESGRYAYISALRPEGYGNLDIYRVVFHDVAIPYTTIRGNLLNPDSSNIFSPVMPFSETFSAEELFAPTQSTPFVTTENPNITIEVYDTNNGTLYGRYTPNPISGSYIAILAPGDYKLLYKGENYKNHKEKIHIPEIDRKHFVITKKIVLSPKDDDF